MQINAKLYIVLRWILKFYSPISLLSSRLQTWPWPPFEKNFIVASPLHSLWGLLCILYSQINWQFLFPLSTSHHTNQSEEKPQKSFFILLSSISKQLLNRMFLVSSFLSNLLTTCLLDYVWVGRFLRLRTNMYPYLSNNVLNCV